MLNGTDVHIGYVSGTVNDARKKAVASIKRNIGNRRLTTRCAVLMDDRKIGELTMNHIGDATWKDAKGTRVNIDPSTGRVR